MVECQVAAFDLNNRKYGAEISQIQSIAKYQELTVKPDMQSIIDGLIYLNDREVPIVDLNRRFGLGETKITVNTKILITKIGMSLIGFVVNSVDKIIKLSETEFEDTPEIISEYGVNFIKRIGKKDEKLLPILDLSRILTENELESLIN